MTIHIVPTNEEHSLESTCPCEPKLDIVNDTFMFIHNSFDGREFLELGRDVLGLPQDADQWETITVD